MPKIRGIKPEFWTDDVMVERTPLARLMFIGLWNYACDNGHLEDKPRQIKMRVLPADDCSSKALIDELIDAGRLVREDGFLVIVNFHHQRIDRRYFTTCAKPGCERPPEEKPTSQRESRSGHVGHTSGTRRAHKVSTPGPHVDCDGEGDGDGDGERSVGTAIALPDPPRPDVTRICEHLADSIHANGAKKPTIGKAWHDAARLMLDRDHLTESEIHAAIDWCQADEFWRSNILSMTKLREQFDRLKMQAKRKHPQARRGDIDWDGAQRRAAAREATYVQGEIA